jgi:zinc transport system permease protein
MAIILFQARYYNSLIYLGMNPILAKAHGVPVAALQYIFAGLLALLVMFSVSAVGVLLVTALLIVPAAAARNLARTAGQMFWWALLIGLFSAFAGLAISAQDWARTATGATIILCACLCFLASILVSKLYRN